MSKVNENAPFQLGTSDEPGARSFAPHEMVRCDSCLRANPPTRVNCLYCAAVLPANESTIDLQKPALRPLEKWERGYNNILLPASANPSEAALIEAADALKLSTGDLSKILDLRLPLPLARAASMDEASLIQRRLDRLEIKTLIIADTDLGLDGSLPIKVRGGGIEEAGITVYQTPEAPTTFVSWKTIVLLVVGRLIVKRVELKEQNASRAENRILDTSEFYTDELVMDFYGSEQSLPYRVGANSFDFSCLEERKSLLSHENIAALLNVFRSYAPNAEFDDSYSSVRRALDIVWPSEQRNESRGWRRERTGKVSLGTVNEITNDSQFSRYSRLRFYLTQRKSG